MSSKERSMHDPGEYVQHGLHIMQSMQSSSYLHALKKILKRSMLKHKSTMSCKIEFYWTKVRFKVHIILCMLE